MGSIYYDRGRAYEEKGNLDHARDDYEKCLELVDPDNPCNEKDIADIHRRLKDIRQRKLME
ncbi:MAG: tetratricopeptide repeat protein [Candidatus Eremiobacteraeota bacterium]|nr:tetratricopeptide repeat protein [Candidatus Eremiobacteraeota bacterium]